MWKNYHVIRIPLAAFTITKLKLVRKVEDDKLTDIPFSKKIEMLTPQAFLSNLTWLQSIGNSCCGLQV